MLIYGKRVVQTHRGDMVLKNVSDVFFGTRRRTEWTVAFLIALSLFAALFPEVAMVMLENLTNAVIQVLIIILVPLIGFAFLKHVFMTKPGGSKKKRRP